MYACNAPTDSACTAPLLKVAALFKLHRPNGELKIRRRRTNPSWRTFAASDLPSLFTSRWNHRRRTSRFDQSAGFVKTEPRQRCTKVSAISRGGSIFANHLSCLDVLVARYHPDG
jgi:hypothetical protein